MRIGVDTGGTFTDLVLVAGGRVHTHKLLSSPGDPATAVLAGLSAIIRKLESPANPGSVVHGSTVATNALLERRGARAALVTTAGFEDVLEIGRQDRPSLHSLEPRRSPPVIPAELRLGVEERLAADGSVVLPLQEEAVTEVTRMLEEIDPESVAVVLLHSYANPRHEEIIASRLREKLGVPITVSSRLLPEYREYERTSTAAVNAYVAPKMAGYLARLEEALSRLPGSPPLRIMRSDGGTMTAAAAGDEAVHTVLSGPAGGVVGAAACARSVLTARLNSAVGAPPSGPDPAGAPPPRAIAFDMGGTSTDVCLIDGRPAVTKSAVLGGHPVRVPVLDIHTVGAGGGSIAWRDSAGALRVGPKSAGADPGPACYGLGGTEATVTDADLMLGRLPASVRLAGSLPLDPDAAHQAVERLADDLGLSPIECAKGIVRIAGIVMMRAIRRISLERGHDPRLFSLIAFGGAGGLHACDLADSLSMTEVLIPGSCGLLSAHGMLAAGPERELGRSILLGFPSASSDPALGRRVHAEASSILLGVHEEIETVLRAGLESEGHPPSELRSRRLADMRYLGQSHELTIEVDASRPIEDLLEAFHEAHLDAFGYRLDREVELVTARVRLHGSDPDLPPHGAPPGDPIVLRGGTHDRAHLAAGSRIEGPATIFEYSATTFVAPGWTALVETEGTMSLKRGMP